MFNQLPILPFIPIHLAVEKINLQTTSCKLIQLEWRSEKRFHCDFPRALIPFPQKDSQAKKPKQTVVVTLDIFYMELKNRKWCFLCVQFYHLELLLFHPLNPRVLVMKQKCLQELMDVTLWQIVREAEIICGRRNEISEERNLHTVQS